MSSISPRRRAVLAAGIWSVPAVTVAAAAPMASASPVPDMTVKIPKGYFFMPCGSTTTGSGVVKATATNVGGLETDGTPVTVTIPAPTSGTMVPQAPPAGWTATGGSGSAIVYTTTNVIAAGATFEFPIDWTGIATGAYTIQATVAGGGDSDATNNDSSAIWPGGSIDMVAKTEDVNKVGTLPLGVPVTINSSVTVTSNSPTNGSAITVKITKFNAGGIMSVPLAPPGWTMVDAGGTYNFTTSQVLAPGTIVNFPYTVTRTTLTTGTFVFRTVLNNGSGGDCVTGNNSATLNVPYS